MKKAAIAIVTTVVIALALAGTLYWLWSVRTTDEQIKETSKTVRREFRKAPLDEAPARLRELANKQFFTVRFPKSFPYLTIGFEPRVPYDFIGLLVEEAFIRLAGDSKSPKEDTERRIKDMIAVANEIISKNVLSQTANDSLRERRLDGYFLVGDYDSAIAEMDVGIPGHTEGWSKSTAAKLRAHKAMEAGQRKEAIKQLKIFIDYMLSDEMKDFEDSDPANGVVYSREWVAAKNYMRCATLAGEDGDAKAKADFTEKAKPLYQEALKKAKDDDISIKELKEEMKANGL